MTNKPAVPDPVPAPPAETLSRGVRNGRRWLTRQQVPDGCEPELDEGDCRICGGAAGEGHEPLDVCGIIADLLCEIEGLRAALRASPPPAPPAVPPQPEGVCETCHGPADWDEFAVGALVEGYAAGSGAKYPSFADFWPWSHVRLQLEILGADLQDFDSRFKATERAAERAAPASSSSTGAETPE